MEDKFLKQVITDFNPYHDDKFMTYEDGLLLHTAMEYYNFTKDDFYLSFVEDYLDRFIDCEGQIKNYRLTDFNIDNIQAGNALFEAFDISSNPKFLKAINVLAEQLNHHPRTVSGSFWHKQRYPFQIWLDGLYMGQVFRVRYALLTKNREILIDVMQQFENVRTYLWDTSRLTYVHAYDESKQMQWADKTTGQSPNLWSRSIGWLAMALVDIIEILQKIEPVMSKKLAIQYTEMIQGLSKYIDKSSNMLYQVVDLPNQTGNYLETSGSAMIAYSLIKAYRLNVMPKQSFLDGVAMISGIDLLYLKEVNGVTSLGGICAVAGLDNEKRNGSVAYYLSERISDSDIKGLAPYFLSKLEIEKCSLKAK